MENALHNLNAMLYTNLLMKHVLHSLLMVHNAQLENQFHINQELQHHKCVSHMRIVQIVIKIQDVDGLY